MPAIDDGVVQGSPDPSTTPVYGRLPSRGPGRGGGYVSGSSLAVHVVYKIFLSSPHSNFILSVPFALQAEQAVALDHLSLSMCLWSGQARAELLYFTPSGPLYPSKEYMKI